MKKDFIDIWKDFNKVASDVLINAKFHDQQSKFVLALFARINSLSDEIFILAKSGRFTSAEIIMRSSLESSIDLKCLILDETYIEKIFAAETEAEYKSQKNYSENNPYYGGVDPLSDEDLRKMKQFKGLNIFDRFKKAGKENLYRTVYNNLCRHSHGNITYLASKNFYQNQILINPPAKREEQIFILSSTLNVAIHSAFETVTFFTQDESILESLSVLSKRVEDVTSFLHRDKV